MMLSIGALLHELSLLTTDFDAFLTDGASTELDALGDELLMDDDSSYLDEASTAPSIPEGLPGATSTNKVLQFYIQLIIRRFSLHSFY